MISGVSCFELDWVIKLKMSIFGFQCPDIIQTLKPSGLRSPIAHSWFQSIWSSSSISLPTTGQSSLHSLKLALNQLVQMSLFFTLQVYVGRCWGDRDNIIVPFGEYGTNSDLCHIEESRYQKLKREFLFSCLRS